MKSSSDRVVEWVNTGIRNGSFVPGQRLIEADLTNSLGVSRGPVREAFKRLAAEGILTLTRHRGALIRSFSRSEAIDMLVVIETLTRLMARLAALQISKGEKSARLESASLELKAYSRGRVDKIASVQDRAHFYETLIEIGGNTRIEEFRPSMVIQLLRQQMLPFASESDKRDILSEYADITDAVLAGDVKRADKTMGKHFEAAFARLSRTPDEAFRRD